MFRRLAIPAACAFAPAAFAQTAPQQLHAGYAVYSHELHVADVTADYKLQPWGYGIVTSIKAGGLMSWFLRMNTRMAASGRFDASGISPISFDSAGFSRGADRHMTIAYNDTTPSVTVHTPPDADREAVATTLLPHAVDTLSAMALLLNTLNTTGRCDGHVNIYDGIRLTAMQSHGPVAGDVPTTDGEVFTGPAARCDFVGQQVAGFVINSPNRSEMATPRPGSAWFQTVPGYGRIAVRIEFDHPKLGHLTAILKKPT